MLEKLSVIINSVDSLIQSSYTYIIKCLIKVKKKINEINRNNDCISVDNKGIPNKYFKSN